MQVRSTMETLNLPRSTRTRVEKYYHYLERNQQHLNEEEFVGGLPSAQAAAKGSAAARTAQRDAGVV